MSSYGYASNIEHAYGNGDTQDATADIYASYLYNRLCDFHSELENLTRQYLNDTEDEDDPYTEGDVDELNKRAAVTYITEVLDLYDELHNHIKTDRIGATLFAWLETKIVLDIERGLEPDYAIAYNTAHQIMLGTLTYDKWLRTLPESRRPHNHTQTGDTK